MTVYQVRLLNREIGLDETIEVSEDEYILDIAEDYGIRLPCGCKQGSCSACIGKLVSGAVDQSGQKFLSYKEKEAGYILTCIAIPLSNCTVYTHQEQVLYKSSLYYQNNDHD